MKASKPALSAVLGDSLSSPPVANCVPTRGLSEPLILRPEADTDPTTRRDSSKRESNAKQQQSVVHQKELPESSSKEPPKPAVDIKPARFSSTNGVITMSAPKDFPNRQSSNLFASTQQGLALNSSRRQSVKAAVRKRDQKQQIKEPQVQLSWLIPVLTIQYVPRPLPITREGPVAVVPMVRDVSILLAFDLLHTLVQAGSPWIILHFNRAMRRWRRSEYAPMVDDEQELMLMSRRVSMATRQRRTIRSPALIQSGFPPGGIKNYGQTCFINSVLQALASLEPFLLYLDRITELHYEQIEYGSGRKHCLSADLYALLNSLNHSTASHCDVRDILYRVSRENKQFRPVHGRGRGSVGREQQDAQELLQALLDMISNDAHFSSDCSLESSFVSSTVSTVTDDNDESSLDFISLCGLLTKMNLERETGHTISSHPGYFPPEGSLPNDGYTAYVSHIDEEKKQDDHDHVIQKDPSTTMKSPQEGNGSHTFLELQHAPSAARFMLQGLSPVTPTPFSGWTGSSTQCCTCQHVRPISNQPFLGIPITPTSLSLSDKPRSSAPPCTLEECLQEYTSPERVEDVECRKCTIDQEIELVEDEVLMLRGAISTVMNRVKAASADGDGEGHVKGLQLELAKAGSRLEMLRSLNPDEGDDLDVKSDPLDDYGLEESHAEKALKRGPAKRCEFFTRLPVVLCLHVQRKFFDVTTSRTAKVIQHVEFPLELDVSPYCAYGGKMMNGEQSWAGSGSKVMPDSIASAKPIFYKLQSVIEHRGNAIHGHYQTYRRVGEQWYLISDQVVSPVQWRQVKKCQAYMLFYEAM
jgi:ubiquitin C-terminal hydrolase